MTLFAGTVLDPFILHLRQKNRRRTTMGQILREAGYPEGAVHQGKRLQKLARITSKELAQILRVILQCVRKASHKQAAGLARSVRSCTKTGRQSKRTKKGGGKRSVALVRKREAFELCVSRCGAVKSQNQFYGSALNPSRPKRRGSFGASSTTFCESSGKKFITRGGSPTHPHERRFHAPQIRRTHPRTYLGKRAMCPPVKHGTLQEQLYTIKGSWIRTERHPSRFGSLVSSCAIIFWAFHAHAEQSWWTSSECVSCHDGNGYEIPPAERNHW